MMSISLSVSLATNESCSPISGSANFTHWAPLGSASSLVPCAIESRYSLRTAAVAGGRGSVGGLSAAELSAATRRMVDTQPARSLGAESAGRVQTLTAVREAVVLAAHRLGREVPRDRLHLRTRVTSLA